MPEQTEGQHRSFFNTGMWNGIEVLIIGADWKAITVEGTQVVVPNQLLISIPRPARPDGRTKDVEEVNQVADKQEALMREYGWLGSPCLNIFVPAFEVAVEKPIVPSKSIISKILGGAQ